MGEERKKEKDLHPFQQFIRRDFWYILVIMFALFACIYTILHTGEYVDNCNQYWEEQFIEKGCSCTGQRFKEPIGLMFGTNYSMEVEDENQDQNTNT